MVVLAAMLATSACDLVFPPAHLGGPEPADGPPSTTDGPPGTADAPGTGDGPGPVPDAPGQPDAQPVCTPLACLGDNAVNGTATCGPQATQWCSSPELDP